MTAQARLSTIAALLGVVLLAGCGNDLESRNEAATGSADGAQRGMTIVSTQRRQAGSTAAPAPTGGETVFADEEVADSEDGEPLMVDASPDDLVDNAEGFSTDPIDNAQGWDPSPRGQSSNEEQE